MLRKSLLAAISTMVLATQANAETIRFSNWLPPTHPITTDILEPWAASVEEATEGRVTVNFIPALGKPPAHFDLVRDGIADAAMSVNAYTADRFPAFYGMTLPGLADDATTASVAYWRTHQADLAQLDEYDGVHLLGVWMHGPGHVFTKDKPVEDLSDLSGLRLRATGGIVQEMSDSLGIVPQFASASEAYELMSRGVVDGVMFNADSVVSFRMLDILNNAYKVPRGLYRDAHYVIMNPRKYESLSEEDQAAIDRVSGEALARLAGAAWDNVDAKAWEEMEAAGYTIVEAGPEDVAEIAERAEPLKAAWLERMEALGVDGQAVLDRFSAEVEKVASE